MKNELWYASSTHTPVVGHRGIRSRYPENTLISFDAAIRLGVDMIEFDINVTKDGIPVVIHDATIDRTSNRSGAVRDYTLKELKSFDFGSHLHEVFRGEQIPSLEEVLALASPKKDLLFNIEIKDMTEEAVDKTVAAVKSFSLEERVVIASFDGAILRYTKATYPFLRCQGFPGRFMKNFTENTYDCMFGMGIPITWKSCTEESIRRDILFAKERSILAWLFCADTEENVLRCVKNGCDNITGNDPAVALNVLRTLGKHH